MFSQVKKISRTLQILVAFIVVFGLVFSPVSSAHAQETQPPPDEAGEDAGPQEPVDQIDDNPADEPALPAEATPEAAVETPGGEPAAEPVIEQTVAPVEPAVADPAAEAPQVPGETGETVQESAQPVVEPVEENISDTEVVLTEEQPTENLAEVLDVMQDTGAVLLDGSGNEVPLASETAVEVLAQANDPWFIANDGSGTVVGYTTIGGVCHPSVTECNPVESPVDASLTDDRSTGQVVNLLAGYYDERITLSKQVTLQGIMNGILTDAIIREIELLTDVPIGSHVLSPLVWVDGGAKIQDGIDLVQAGGTVNVFPEIYHEKAIDRTVDGGSTSYQFGLYIGPDKDGITVQSVSLHGGYPLTECCGVTYIYTDATNNFGYSGVFVEGNNVTLNGFNFMDNLSGNNKTIEVIGNNFTLKNSAIQVSDGGSVYINDWNFDQANNISSITSFTIENNKFLYGASLDISSGAGFSGSADDRRIVNNLFDGRQMDGSDADWALTSFNGIVPSVGWFINPVGGATISGNTYQNGLIYIRSRGTVDEDSFDWESYWNGNTFDHAVITLQDKDAFDPRAHSYDSGSAHFDNVIRIGSNIQSEIDNVAQDDDTVLLGRGTFTENVVMNKPLEIAGSGAGETTILPAVSDPACPPVVDNYWGLGCSDVFLVQADDVIIHDLTVNGNNPNLTSGYVVNGEDIDARFGIVTDDRQQSHDNLEVYNTNVINIFLRGILSSTDQETFNFHDNYVNNIDGDPLYSVGIMGAAGTGSIVNNHVVNTNIGIESFWSRGIQILNNLIENADTGILSYIYGSEYFTSPLNPELIQSNSVKDSPDGIGIQVERPSDLVTVDSNNIENVSTGLYAYDYMCEFLGCNGGWTVFSNNNVNGMWKPESIGAFVRGDYGVISTFFNNLIHNNDIGFFVQDVGGPPPAGGGYINNIQLNAYHNGIVNNNIDVYNHTNSQVMMQNNWWNANDGPESIDDTGNTNWYQWIKLGLMTDPTVISTFGASELDSYMYSTGDWQSAPITDMGWFYPLDVFNFEETDLGSVYWNVFTADGTGGTAEISSYYFGETFHGLAYIDIITTPEEQDVVEPEPEVFTMAGDQENAAGPQAGGIGINHSGSETIPPMIEIPGVVIPVEDTLAPMGSSNALMLETPIHQTVGRSIDAFLEEENAGRDNDASCANGDLVALARSDSVYSSIPLCGFSAGLDGNGAAALPSPLPEGLTFGAAMNLDPDRSGELPASVSFMVPTLLQDMQEVVLHWKATRGEWEEVPATATGVLVTAAVETSGLFVLAGK